MICLPVYCPTWLGSETVLLIILDIKNVLQVTQICTSNCGKRSFRFYFVSFLVLQFFLKRKRELVSLLLLSYGKAVFVRISDDYAANILRTTMFTVIVRYIFTSCREYPANKVGLTKK